MFAHCTFWQCSHFEHASRSVCICVCITCYLLNEFHCNRCLCTLVHCVQTTEHKEQVVQNIKITLHKSLYRNIFYNEIPSCIFNWPFVYVACFVFFFLVDFLSCTVYSVHSLKRQILMYFSSNSGDDDGGFVSGKRNRRQSIENGCVQMFDFSHSLFLAVDFFFGRAYSRSSPMRMQLSQESSMCFVLFAFFPSSAAATATIFHYCALNNSKSGLIFFVKTLCMKSCSFSLSLWLTSAGLKT